MNFLLLIYICFITSFFLNNYWIRINVLCFSCPLSRRPSFNRILTIFNDRLPSPTSFCHHNSLVKRLRQVSSLQLIQNLNWSWLILETLADNLIFTIHPCRHVTIVVKMLCLRAFWLRSRDLCCLIMREWFILFVLRLLHLDSSWLYHGIHHCISWVPISHSLNSSNYLHIIDNSAWGLTFNRLLYDRNSLSINCGILLRLDCVSSSLRFYTWLSRRILIRCTLTASCSMKTVIHIWTLSLRYCLYAFYNVVCWWSMVSWGFTLTRTRPYWSAVIALLGTSIHSYSYLYFLFFSNLVLRGNCFLSLFNFSYQPTKFLILLLNNLIRFLSYRGFNFFFSFFKKILKLRFLLF